MSVSGHIAQNRPLFNFQDMTPLFFSSEIVPPIFEEQSPKKVLDAQSRFAKKRYKHKFHWTPDPEIETAIMTAIFGKNMAP